jgi:UDP-N-acetylglucosamine 2-epimerase (non-hydrolysing)
VIIESTISPQTSLEVAKRLVDVGLKVDVVHCPERAIPGSTLNELVNNDRIIGAENKAAQLKVKAINQSFVEGEIFLNDLTTAECIKLVENTSRDVGIAFGNELAEICTELKVDPYEVIRLANRHPRVNVLKSVSSVADHCIPIDPWFLVENTNTGDFVRLARAINDKRPVNVTQKVIELTKSIGGNNVGVLGVAYKPNVDDCRETPAAPLVKTLQKANLNVKYHDPYVRQWSVERINKINELVAWADIVVQVMGHNCYKGMKSSSTLIDTCGLLHQSDVLNLILPPS